MTKLISAYRKLPSMKNRSRLQEYLDSHPMAICMATANDIEFLKSNLFLI
jgi:hypothetical protein